MGIRLRTWWQKVKKPLEFIGVTTALVLIFGLLVLIVAGYIFRWPWTGFGPETSEPKLHAKTLWDWLQLLIIPLVLAVGGYTFNLTVSRNEQQNTRLRDQTEREISLDNQQEAALQAYIDKMSELLLEKKLRESVAEDEVRKIARVRTLTVLPRLDKGRKGSVLRFLHESGLIEKNKIIVDLNGANLEGADLSEANLEGADLSYSDLEGANLSRANLGGVNLGAANLKGANLSEATLGYADLTSANLSGATLEEANLNGASFGFANLEGATLEDANLEEAILGLANLKGATLEDAYLEDANLSYSDLEGANLSRANLSGANLEETNLKGANLKDATISQQQLDNAKSLQKATMPDGTTHS